MTDAIPIGYYAAVKYRKESDEPFADRKFRTRAAADHFAAAWTVEAESLGYPAAPSVTEVPYPLDEGPGEERGHGLPWRGDLAKSEAEARCRRVLAELSRRGLALADQPLPVKEMASELGLSCRDMHDALLRLKTLAKQAAAEEME